MIRPFFFVQFLLRFWYDPGMARTRFILNNLYIAALILLSGCASTTHTIQERYFWPPPPNPPHIEWLAAYQSQLDFDKTPLARFKDAIVGTDDPVALQKPVDVRVDSLQDKIYVADLGARSVFVFDLRKKEMRTLSTAGANLRSAILPMAIALDRSDNLYVLDSRLKLVLIFDPTEKIVGSIKLEKICHRPVALAIDKSRARLYVADIESNKVFALELNGKLLFSIGGNGDADAEFNHPISMTVDSKGEIIVADAFNSRIQIFDDQGAFRRSFGHRGIGEGDFQLIKAVAVDSDDNIYVADGKSNNIKIFNQVGDLLLTFGGFYAVSSGGKLAPGGFALPIGIDIDSRNRIFIVDQINARVQAFQYLSSKAGLPASQDPQHAK